MKHEQSLSNKEALTPYKNSISRYIRSVMVLKAVKYEDLVFQLTERGVVLTADNLRSKVSKGMFSADLLVAILECLGVEESALPEIIKLAHIEK